MSVMNTGVHHLIGTDIEGSGPPGIRSVHTYGFTDRDACRYDAISELYLAGDGASLRMMMEDTAHIFELMDASGMIKYWADDSTSSQRDQEELMDQYLITEECNRGLIRGEDEEILEEIEWLECCEPSYFMELDMCTGVTRMVADSKGNPTLHDAQRHAQQCSLNELLNPMDSTGRGGTVRSEEWEIDNVYEMGIICDCKLVSIGQAYAVALCEYGAVWVSKSCFPYLPAVTGIFRASVQVSLTGRYPLRVLPRGIH